MREQNQEADQLANDAMDRGMGRSVTRTTAPATRPILNQPQEFEGIVRDGTVHLSNGTLPEGTRVQVRVKK